MSLANFSAKALILLLLLFCFKTLRGYMHTLHDDIASRDSIMGRSFQGPKLLEFPISKHLLLLYLLGLDMLPCILTACSLLPMMHRRLLRARKVPVFAFVLSWSLYLTSSHQYAFHSHTLEHIRFLFDGYI